MNLKLEKDNIGLGKRKQATARVFLVPEKGTLLLIKFQVKNTYNTIQLI
jgi:ribosomal protein S9